jgi:aspartate kinase
MNEEVMVVGISSEPSVVSLRLVGVPDGPEPLDRILSELAQASVDLRSIERTHDRLALLVAADALPALPEFVTRLRAAGIVHDAVIGSAATPVSVVGSRLNARLTIATRMFRALSREGINSEWLTTSEARISCLVGDGDRSRALHALQAEFLEELEYLKEGVIGI